MTPAQNAATRYLNFGNQVRRDGAHFAYASSDLAAAAIANAMNPAPAASEGQEVELRAIIRDLLDGRAGARDRARAALARAGSDGWLSDPTAVHINMLRGGVAKPTPVNIWHLYGDDALIAAMPASARAKVADQNAATGEQFAENAKCSDEWRKDEGWRRQLNAVFARPGVLDAMERGLRTGGYPMIKGELVNWSDWLIYRMEIEPLPTAPEAGEG